MIIEDLENYVVKTLTPNIVFYYKPLLKKSSSQHYNNQTNIQTKSCEARRRTYDYL